MAKRKVKSQTNSLTPNHKISGIDPISVHEGGMQHTVGKLLTKTITVLQTSSQSEVWARSYSPTKLQKFQPWQFRNSWRESRDKKPFGCSPREEVQSILNRGKVVTSPKLGPWWVLWVLNRPWFVLAPKVLQHSTNDAFLSPLLDPLEGLSMLSCGKLGLEGHSRLPTLKGGRGAS
jgi:hypothetical protein